MTLTEQLRQAIRDSGKSANALAREIAIPQQAITTFLNGSDIRLKTADKLAAYFGLSLTPDKSARPAKPPEPDWVETIEASEKGKAKEKQKAEPAAVPAVDWKTAKPEPESRVKAKIRVTPPPVKSGKSPKSATRAGKAASRRKGI